MVKNSYILSLVVSMIAQSANGRHGPANERVAEIRVYNDFDLPLEPAKLFSMSEYNLSLCLFSTLFVLDDASVPRSDILASWKYVESAAAYDFMIRDGIYWSDGLPFTAKDVKLSIARLKDVAPTHYRSITSLLIPVRPAQSNADDGIEVISHNIVRFHVGHPTPDLFNRLTAVFIPMVRQDLLDPKTLRVARHDITLGPYTLDSRVASKDRIFLVKNARYFLPSKDMALSIEMRPYRDKVPRAEDIARDDFWANLILDRAFTPKEGWTKLNQSGASIWTRPVDRILYMYPTKNGVRRDVPAVLRWFGSKLAEKPLDSTRFPGLQPARALQPKGFFLHEQIKYGMGKAPRHDEVLKVAIINQQIPADFLQEHFRTLGLNIAYDLLSIPKRNEAQESDKYDIVISTFGAADPDPVTWLSLVLGNDQEFIGDYDHAYRHEFEKIKNIRDAATRIARLRELITRAGSQGLYVPIAHFSSIAVTNHSLDLKQIRPSDETVDLSKVIVRRP
jgi:ABC-type oligopeptide transport system substrate-binding subunit